MGVIHLVSLSVFVVRKHCNRESVNKYMVNESEVYTAIKHCIVGGGWCIIILRSVAAVIFPNCSIIEFPSWVVPFL